MNNIEIDNDEEINFKNILKKKNYIATKNLMEKIKKIADYISKGIPILLQGPTGTSKTSTVEISCIFAKTKRNLIKYHMSSDLCVSDIIGKKLIDNENSVDEEGYFLKAFKDGYPILLENINFSSEDILEFIREALDLNSIKLQEKIIKKHPDFCLLATQNLIEGQNLKYKLLSKFKVVSFPEISIDELTEISKGLSQNYGFKDDRLLDDLIYFHKLWTDKKDDNQCFTLREIDASIKAISKGRNILNTLMTIYGGRYQNYQKEKLENLLRTIYSFHNLKSSEFETTFPRCFHNKIINEASKLIKCSINSGRHIIITGDKEVGKTQLASWFAKWYINEKKMKKSEIYYCLCTQELKCADLIGYKKVNENKPWEIKWKNGFLLDAIEKGGVVILDAINESNNSVRERIKELFNEKYSDLESPRFSVPENHQKPEIIIHSNFVLICILDIDEMSKMFPSFLNRFDIILLEEQMKCITDIERKRFIEFYFLKNEINNITTIRKNFERRNSFYSNSSKDNNSEELNRKMIINFKRDNSSSRNSNNSRSQRSKSSKSSISLRKVKSENNDSFFGNYDEEEFEIEMNLEEEEMSENIFNLIPNSLIDLIYEKANEFKTIYKLKQFCMIINKLLFYFKSGEINKESIINFSYTLLSLKDGTGNEFENLEIEPKIVRSLLYNNSYSFCGESKILRNYIAIIHAFQILNIHLSIYGPPKVGKTSSILLLEEFYNKCEIHSFNEETIPDHYYGIKKKKNIAENDSLTNSLISGHIFIAENLNLSSESTIKAIAPALENNYLGKIYFPGIENPIKIHTNFFFVACQNEIGTKGRNKLPANISRKLKTIFYPSVHLIKDIDDIIREIKSNLDKEYHFIEHYASFRIDTEELAEFIFTLNKKKLYKNYPWSFRDIKIIFERQFLQSYEIYKNIDIYKNIIFYFLKPFSEEEINKKEEIVKIFLNSFRFCEDDKEEIKECIKSFAKLIIDEEGYLGIKKRFCGIFPLYKMESFSSKNKLKNKPEKFQSLIEDLFYLCLERNKEYIISQYKLFILYYYMILVVLINNIFLLFYRKI